MKKLFQFKNVKNTKRIEFLAPKFIYLPITQKIDKPLSMGEKILKGQYLNKNNYSSVSGKIVGSKKCDVIDKKINSVIIANNYKEQRIKKVKENKIDRLKRLIDDNLLNKLESGKRNLVLSCFNDKPYVYNNETLITDCYQDILDIVYLIKNNYKFDNIYIIVKDIESKSIEKFTKIIGSYPELQFITIPNVYPVNNTDYYSDVLKISDYILITFEELYKMYHIIKYSFGNTETIITINIDDKNPIIVKTKIGISIIELFENIKVKYNDYNIFLNGTIGNIKKDNIEDLIVTPSLYSIVLTKTSIPDAKKCINCGNCSRYCPKNIDPKRAIADKEYRKEARKICIKCGLCDYICPCYIRLKESIERDD